MYCRMLPVNHREDVGVVGCFWGSTPRKQVRNRGRQQFEIFTTLVKFNGQLQLLMSYCRATAEKGISLRAEIRKALFRSSGSSGSSDEEDSTKERPTQRTRRLKSHGSDEPLTRRSPLLAAHRLRTVTASQVKDEHTDKGDALKTTHVTGVDVRVYSIASTSCLSSDSLESGSPGRECLHTQIGSQRNPRHGGLGLSVRAYNSGDANDSGTSTAQRRAELGSHNDTSSTPSSVSRMDSDYVSDDLALELDVKNEFAAEMQGLESTLRLQAESLLSGELAICALSNHLS